METGISRASVDRIAKIELGLTPFKLINVQRLTREDEKREIETGKKLLRCMKLVNLEKTFLQMKRSSNCKRRTANKMTKFTE